MMLPHRLSKLVGTLAVLGAVSTAAIPQEHAPTVEQCRADAAVWAKADFKIPTMKELWARCHEMTQCTDVDPPEKAHELYVRYVEVCNGASREYTDRVIRFLDRHNPSWKQQFDDEDAAGKR